MNEVIDYSKCTYLLFYILIFVVMLLNYIDFWNVALRVAVSFVCLTDCMCSLLGAGQ